VALYAALWTPSARAASPAVDSRQDGVAGTLRPILNNLTAAQARAHLRPPRLTSSGLLFR